MPESVIRRRFAAEIRKEVIDTLLPERFNKGVNELGIRPVGQPQVTELTVDEGAPLHVKAVFEFIPAFSIDGYKDVTVDKPSVEVTEEEFQHEIEHLRDPAPPSSRWKKTARSRTATGPRSATRARSRMTRLHPRRKPKLPAEAAAGRRGEDTLVEIGGKDTVEAFTNALRGAKPGQELKARSHLSRRLR